MLRKYQQTILFFSLSYLSIFIFSILLYSDFFSNIFSYEIILKSILSSTIIWYILYLVSSIRVLYYLFVILLTLIVTIKLYYIYFLNVAIEPAIFEGMFDTNLDEMERLGSNKPIFIFITTFLFIMLFINFYWLKSLSFRKKVFFHFFKLFIIIGLVIGYGFYTEKLNKNNVVLILEKVFPISFFKSFSDAATSRYKLYTMNTNKVNIVKKYNFIKDNKDYPLIIFVRGESLRARSFPIIDKNIPISYRLDDLNNTVFYKNVFSYANYTQAAVPWMLTRSKNNMLNNEHSLISVVKYMGWNTTWIGCDHSNLANFATPIVNYALEADESLFLGKLNDWMRSNDNNDIYSVSDSKQFKYLLSALNSKLKKEFFWLEMNGSHVPWSGTPHNNFSYYTPVCTVPLDEIKQCEKDKAINSYKTTILYTQYLLKKLILTLKNKNALVIFASDHGESTGEHGYYGHGFMLPEGKRKIRDQINPAFMVWMSDKFKSNHMKEYKALKDNSKKYMKHDIIFHSVLDILGIKSSIIEKSKSIFSDNFLDKEKPINIQIKKEKIILDKFENNEAIFHLQDVNPQPRTSAHITFTLPSECKEIYLNISDLYKESAFPDRIKYKIVYNNNLILKKDLSENKEDLLKIKLLPNNKVIDVYIEVQDKIETDWSWGSASKIKIKFLKEKI